MSTIFPPFLHCQLAIKSFLYFILDAALKEPHPIARGSINPRIYQQLEKQLAKEGAKTIYKALRSAEKSLEKHIRKIDNLKFKSQVEGTIRNVANQIKTIQKFIKDKGL